MTLNWNKIKTWLSRFEDDDESAHKLWEQKTRQTEEQYEKTEMKLRDILWQINWTLVLKFCIFILYDWFY